ncbi:hypothetical protein CSA37_07570 [Candidatus Fermentibacteria bacterium]|nr:MAG: hypothetical protein CSA37_07570 [Candidatus Fermentibacteria bacterium]
MNSNLRILLICYHYPPSAVVGGKRPSNLVREMVNNRCEVDVVSPAARYFDTVDENLTVYGHVYRTSVFPFCPRSPSSKSIYHLLLKIWKSFFTLVDRFEGFILSAFLKAMGLLRKRDYSAILVSGPPFSPFIAAWLASFFSKVPLVLEYRDPWSNLERRKNNSAFRRFLERQLEKLISNRASAIVFVTDEMLNDFRKSFNSCSAPMKVISSGCTAFPGIPEQARKDSSHLNVLYSGKFYGERRIGLIASVLNDFIRDTGTKVTMTVLGNLKADDREQFMRDAPEAVLDEKGFLSYRKALELTGKADILLLISGRDVAYAVPFKFYDYLSSGKPVLAIAPEKSAMAGMMKKIDCGAFASIDSSKQIESAFRKLASPEYVCTGSGKERYTWSRIASDYLDFLKEAVEGKLE